MLPPIGVVITVEMLRDGGSLGAVFQCFDSSIYSLIFKVDRFKNVDGESERRGFLLPVLFEKASCIETNLTWSQAELLLHQIMPLVRTEKDDCMLAVMIEVAQSKGELPPSIDKIIGRPSLFNKGKDNENLPLNAQSS